MFELAKPLIIGNWKMNKTIAEAKNYIKILKPLIADSSSVVGLAVPFTTLAAAAAEASLSKIQIGAQNSSAFDEGAVTGDISAKMAQEAGASFVIAGHSERRRFFQESNNTINSKVRKALAAGLQVILCIGETAEEQKASQTSSILMQQLKEGLAEIDSKDITKIAIAYEPVWAIGNQHPASAENIEKILHLCKNFISKAWKMQEKQVCVLYGGSVAPSNANDFLRLPVVDGLLIGGASLDAQSFAKIIQQAEAQ